MLAQRTPFRSLALVVASTALLAATGHAQVAAVGLSTVRAAMFHNEDLFFYEPQQGDFFGLALATGDFNGDGADDLATGIPWDNGLSGFEEPNIGAVVVRYGIPGRGLDTGLATTFLNQVPGNSPDPADPYDLFGSAVAACDFNADGFDDLAIGIPDETRGGDCCKGAVQIHYGSADGVPAAGQQLIDQDSPGVPGDAEWLDELGSALACGDFNGDGFADLAIGVPYEDQENTIEDDQSVGTVTLVPGSAGGLDTEQAYSRDQGTLGMAGDPEESDYFGAALAVGDLDGDGYDDLVVGVPGENSSAGAVHVIFGSDAGLTVTGNVLFTEESLGGPSEADDQFGKAIAVGDFDGDGFDDIAIGAPTEDLGSLTNCGNVGEVFGGASGLDFARSTGWDEDRVLGAGHTEAWDLFGWALAAGDFDRDGFDDLAVSHPYEYQLGNFNGSVTVFMGSPGGGLDAGRHREISEGLEGFPGNAGESDVQLGRALATGDFDGDGHADLAIGAPYQNGSLPDTGSEMVLYGALFADGFETGGSLWSTGTF